MLLPFAFFYEVAVALQTVSPGQAAVAAQVEQFKDLLTGSMTDQVVTLENQLKLAPGVAAATPAATSWGSVPVKMADTSITSSTASILYSSIPNVFKHLLFMYGGTATGSSLGNYELQARVNSDSSNGYDVNYLFGSSMGGSGYAFAGNILPSINYWRAGAVGSQASAFSGSGGYFMIFNYARNDITKHYVSYDHHFTFGGANNLDLFSGAYRTNLNPITSVTLTVNGSNFLEFFCTVYGIP